MKKWIAILLTLCLALSAFACTKQPAAEPTTAPVDGSQPDATEPSDAPAEPAADGYEIALVTDVGNIDDQSFNQYTWEGTKAWAEANGKTYNYYRPSEDSDEARAETIKTAIEKGAKVIVLPGFLFAGALNIVPQDYPDVTFIGIDMTSKETNPDYPDVAEPFPNTVLISYQEEQSGYLAGYAAVKDGYTKLAYLGGMAVPAVIRYGEGFVQGANAAAAELGNAADVEIKYWYSGSFVPSDDIKTKTAGWYTEGTEIIFAAGGGIVFSAIASAEETANGKLIGVDVDQGGLNERVVTSAMKALANSVQLALQAWEDNGEKLPDDYAGHGITFGVADDAIGLPTAEGSWRFNQFTVDEYEAVLAKIKSGEIVISNDTANHPEVQISVDYQE